MHRIAVVVGLACVAPAARADVVGGTGPTRVVAAAADGGWVVMCQARKDTNRDGQLSVMSQHGGTSGDEQRAYLVVGGGVGTEIDDFITTDPTRRRAVIVRNKRRVLVQPGLGKDVDLTALGATDALAFDPTGDNLVYAKLTNGKAAIAIRDLATGKTRELDPGGGKIDSLRIDDGGRFVIAQVFAMRKGDVPYRTTRLRHYPACRTGFTSDVVTSSGTPAVGRVIPFAGGAALELADGVGFAGDALIRRRPDGALTTERSGAPASELVPAACGGITVGMTAAGTVIVACTKRGKQAPLEEYGGAKPRVIGAAIPPPSGDSTEMLGRYLLVTGRDANDTIVDLVTGKVRTSPEYQQPILNHGDRMLVQRGEKLVAIEPTTERVLGAIEKYPQTIRSGAFVYVEPLVADAITGTVVGTAPARKSTDKFRGDDPGHILALAKDGRILVGYGGLQGWRGFVPGPLEWVKPVPVTP